MQGGAASDVMGGDFRNCPSARAVAVKLRAQPYPLAVASPGDAVSGDVGMFFSIYSRSAPVRLAPAWFDGRKVIAVYEDAAAVI
jgi:hypothetical protein